MPAEVKTDTMQYSIILPTFGRPDEVSNFLESINLQIFNNFEVIVVDGSLDDVLHPVIETYRTSLNLHYFHERGLGASESRNLGCEKSSGKFLVFIDSDCIVPADYLLKINTYLTSNPLTDAFGGPDAADAGFTPFQKAVNYAMTSFLTTGGIRGKKKHLGNFELRGFNMGVRREAFFAVGGYSGMQVAEDIDLSMRLRKAGYVLALIPEAFVYHRRKADLKIFWKQLYFHGKGRIDLHLRHGDALKPVHLLPSFYVIGLLAALITGIFVPPVLFLLLALLLIYSLAVFVDAAIQNKSVWVALLSIVTSQELLQAYGFGMLRNIIFRMILKNGEESKKSIDLKK
jgi:cellulose synthase/poly-beta-1,6-N-acetylglucosamine synthase-like glycosyltransferase